MINVRGYELPVDVLEELQPYEWYKARNRGHELTACSPFRNERTPSFSINLTTGQWIDFGAGDDEPFKKGNLILLLSYLRNETPQEVENYLLDKYGIDLSDVDSLELGLNLSMQEEKTKIITLEEYKKYAYRHPYLSSRGISEKVQRAFKVGFDKEKNAVALAWQDIKGNIVNIKFRSVISKMFYYADGQPIRNHIYGMYFVYKLGCKVVYVVESEIDALYLWTHGKPAIALGGSNITEQQKKLILRSPITDLVIATDNDAAGIKIKNNIIRNLQGLLNLHEAHLPNSVKDVNELPPEYLLQVVENYSPVGLVNNFELN